MDDFVPIFPVCDIREVLFWQPDFALTHLTNQLALLSFFVSCKSPIDHELPVGCTSTDPDNLKFLYEGHENFSALPSYAVIPGVVSSMTDSTLLNEALKPYNIEFNPTKLVHGEQYLELFQPLPTTAAVKSTAKVIDVLDKGSGAVVILASETVDAESGKKLAYNQAALFLVGSGKFGGKKMSDNPENKTVVDPPNRPPDVSVTEKTSSDQAALYRLTGDKNPLHIDPSFASMGGFEKPILHGLCTYGYVTRHIVKQWAGNDTSKIKAIKARFASSVYPGQTLQTDMWREGNRIFFQTKCKETDKPVITGAYADLVAIVEPQPTKVPTSTSDPNNPTPAELAFDTDDANALLTDVVFEEIGRRIAMAPELAKKVNGIFTFVIVKDRQEVKVWTMDMKQVPGKLYQGHSKSAPADCVIRITDQDMTALAVGELDPVRAFMTGKLKIKGNLMATQRLQALFELNSAEIYEKDENLNPDGTKVAADALTNGPTKMEFSPNLAEGWGDFSRLASAGSSLGQYGYPINNHMPPTYGFGYRNEPLTPWMTRSYDPEESYLFNAGGSGDGSSGTGGITPIIDLLFEKWLPTRIDDMKELVPIIKTVYQWNILQKGQVASVWTLDLKNGDGQIHRGPPKSGKADCILSIEDDNAVKIFEGKEDAMRAFMSGKLKITGNIMAAQKLQQVWADEADKVRTVLTDLKAGRDIGGAPASPQTSQPAPTQSTGGEDPDIANYPTTGIKGDIFFNIFKNRCHEEPEFMQRLRVCFQFNITKDGKPVCVWTADNKTTKDVLIYRSPPNGIKPDVTATVEDDDLLKILTGRVNPQRLFMMGRVKVKGNIMLLQKLNGLWAEFQKLGKTPELPLIVDVMLEDPLIPGLKSEGTVIECIQRLVRLPEVKTAPGFHQVNITKDGKVVSTWTLDLKEKFNFLRGPPKKGKVAADSTLTLDDTDFARLVLMKTTFKEALSSGKAKLESGTPQLQVVYEKLFATPTSLKPKL